VLVADRGGRLRLAPEALDHALVLGHVLVQDLDDHALVDELVAREVHGAHAALAEDALHAIATEQDLALEPALRVR